MPLPLRPTLERARDGGVDAPELTAAERNALAVIAEHVRDRAGLQQVWAFAEPPGERVHAAVEEVARAAVPGGEPVPDAAARAIALGALRADPHPPPRPELTFEAGMSVVTTVAGGDRAVLVVASSASGAPVAGGARSALIELAEIAARVLAAPSRAHPRAMQERAARAEAAEPSGGVAAYGAGLADALAQLRRPPVLAESRVRLERALEQRYAALGAAIRTIETDIGLAVAVMRAANEIAGRPRNGVCSVPAALEALGARGVLRVMEGLPELRPLEASDRLGTALRRLAPHAIATRAAADLIGRRVGEPARDQLRLAAALHDLGKVALATASDEYLALLGDPSATPEERLAAERRRMGIDHAAIGAVAATRLGLPKPVAAAIERHHSEDAAGAAAIVRVADMIAHQAHGDAVTSTALAAAARRFRLSSADLQQIAYDLLRAREPEDARAHPSPLTPMQEKVLAGLAEAKTYKQIAADLAISESTVRTHLHNLYGKLEVTDRAQAVLLAADRGWI